MKLLCINGSLRAQSSNLAILRAATRLLDQGSSADYANLATLPAFNPDLDIDTPPDAVQQFRNQIEAAEVLLICSPEYAHGMPGALKNALDWLVSWPGAVDKKTILISASPAGAAHSHAQLLEVLRTMNLQITDAGAHVFSRSAVGENGEVLEGAILTALKAALSEQPPGA